MICLIVVRTIAPWHLETLLRRVKNILLLYFRTKFLFLIPLKSFHIIFLPSVQIRGAILLNKRYFNTYMYNDLPSFSYLNFYIHDLHKATHAHNKSFVNYVGLRISFHFVLVKSLNNFMLDSFF